MVEAAKRTFETHRNFIFYAMIGVSGVLLDLVFFLVFFNLAHIDKNIATFMSTSIGIGNNFIWNASLNFKVKDKMWLRFSQFYGVGMTGILLTFAIFWVFVDHLGINANLVKIGSLFPVLLMQYTINKLWTFRKEN